MGNIIEGNFSRYRNEKLPPGVSIGKFTVEITELPIDGRLEFNVGEYRVRVKLYRKTTVIFSKRYLATIDLNGISPDTDCELVSLWISNAVKDVILDDLGDLEEDDAMTVRVSSIGTFAALRTFVFDVRR